jgi:hypothetical protein
MRYPIMKRVYGNNGGTLRKKIFASGFGGRLSQRTGFVQRECA